MSPLDYYVVSTSLTFSADYCARVRNNQKAAQGYRTTLARLEREYGKTIREDSRRTRKRITAKDVARNLNREVSKVRDLGGSVILAWFPGTGPRFVSRKAILSV